MTKKLELSIVRIYATNGVVVGAGFLVFEKHLLTCAHVVALALGIQQDTLDTPTATISLDFPLIAPSQLLMAKVVCWRPFQSSSSTSLENGEDIALLELENMLPDGARPAQMVAEENLFEHPFRAFGFPEGHSDGGVYISGVLRGRLANGWVQIESINQTGYRVEPGFSGTPLWDETLDGVVGIVVAVERRRTEVGAAFIIPTDILVRAIPKLACPYRGLCAFQEENAPFFFGREQFTETLVEAVRTKPLVAVIGPSGSGKSSVVCAGLIPRLRDEGNWQIVSFRPKRYPFNELATALVRLLAPNSDAAVRQRSVWRVVWF